MDNGEPRCIAFGGMSFDNAMTKVILGVVKPGAVEAAVLASEEEGRKQDEVVEALRRELEAAQYAAQRAQRQYDAADPENRLVADELERRWNQALQRVAEIETRIAQHLQGPQQVATPTQEEFEDLATDLEAVWNSPHADVRLKKRIVRTLIQEVVVDVDAEAGEILLVIHWKGGVHTELRLPRRRRGQNRSHTSPEIVEVVRTLAHICSDDLLANALNRSGLLTGHGNRWTRERVTALRGHHQIPCYDRDRREAEGWMNLTEAAHVLAINPRTLRLAVERGAIEADHPLADGPWVFKRSVLQTPAAAALVARVRRRGEATIPTAEQGTLGFSPI